jgi:SAM-dependent methyltransferase
MTAHQATMAPTDLEGRRALDLFVLDRVKIQAWDRILFVQCGDGWIVEEAWRRAGRAYVCGLDTSDADVALATQLREVPGKVEFKMWDGQCLPVADRAFDRVVAILSPPLATPTLIRDLGRVLRRDGDVYLLYSATADAEMRKALAQAGWPPVREVARSGGEIVVLVHAPAEPSARSGTGSE